MRILLFTLLGLSLLPLPVLAQDMVTECGAPLSGDLNTESVPNFCDIYSRQLAYEQERKSYEAQLKERQQNYHAPRKEAHDNYRENLQALHNSAKTGENTGNE